MDEETPEVNITNPHEVWTVELAETKSLLSLTDNKTKLAMLMLKEAFERGRHAPEGMANPYQEPKEE